MRRELLIKEVKSTDGGLPGVRMTINCTDGTSYRIPRNVPRKTFWDATIAVLKEGEKVINVAKIERFGEDGTPVEYSSLTRDKLILDGAEKVTDCRR